MSETNILELFEITYHCMLTNYFTWLLRKCDVCKTQKQYNNHNATTYQTKHNDKESISFVLNFNAVQLYCI